MSRDLPVDIDEFFIIGTFLVFLMINYNMPLSSIYNQIMMYIIIGYLVPILFDFFRWVPISKSGSSRWTSTLVGVGFGYLFWQVYMYFADINKIGQVFATTAFGESLFLGKVVFGILIPIIETVFFFRIIPQWIAYLLKWERELRIDSLKGHFIAGIVSAVFTFFHATAKGVTNNNELIATFLFAYLSMMLVYYFQEIWQAIVMHIFVNSRSVGLFDALMANGNLMYILVGIGIVIFFVSQSKSSSTR